MKTRPVLCLFGLLTLCAGRAARAEEIPRVPLPAQVISMLTGVPGMTNHLANETNRLSKLHASFWGPRDAWTYEQALDFLKRYRFPDITRCTRVKTPPPPPHPRVGRPAVTVEGPQGFTGASIRTGATNQFLGLWAVTNSSGQVWVIPADFQPLRLDSLPPLNLTAAALREELLALLSVYERRVHPTNLVWNLGLPGIARYKSWDDSPDVNPDVALHHVVCGWWLGVTNEVGALLNSARFRMVFTNSLAPYARSQANLAWAAGLTNLHSGRALVEVLEPWREHVRAFGTNVVPELPEYLEVLEKQVGEYQRLLETTVEVPSRLPARERASYYVERLSQARHDERGAGSFKAGSPMPELLALGREALPVLMEHLDDRRLTRVTGDQYTRVVLVQDLLLDCVERIGGGTFRTNYAFSGKFSVLSPANRAAIAAQAQQWVADYGTKHEAIAKLALVELKPVTARLAVLEELERRYPAVVDGVAYLKRWAADVKPEELRPLAWQLGWRGDRSLLPRLRETVRAGDFQNGDYLATFGEPQDYALLREVIRNYLVAADVLPVRLMVGPIVEIATGNRTNTITPAAYTTPILADLMECRRCAHLADPSQTLADIAFPSLLKLTGRPSNYSPDAPMSSRTAAMDSWVEWWENEGAASYGAQHPEVKALFGKLDSEDGLGAASRLPERILATPFEPVAPTDYIMSREEALELARRHQLRLRLLGNVGIGRFPDAKTEQTWFAGATAGPQLGRGLISSNLPSGPTMRLRLRLQTEGEPWMDSLGRMWCQWDGANRSVARFESGSWRTTPLLTTERYPGDLIPLPLKKGAVLLEQRSAPSSHILLQDAQVIRSKSLADLIRHDAVQLPNLLLFPPPPVELGSWVTPSVRTLVKDGAGNLWWIEDGRDVVVATDGRIVRTPARDLGASAASPVLMPVGNAASVLLGSGQGGAWLLRWNGQSITNTTAIKGAPLMNAPVPAQGPAAFRTHTGEVWLNGSPPLLINAQGQVVRTNAGTVYFEDPAHRLWSKRPAAKLPRLCCRLEDGRELLSEPLDLRGRPAPGGNGCVWVPTEQSLICVRPQGAQLVQLASLPWHFEKGNLLWVDADGNLWVTQGSLPHEFLVCLPGAKVHR